MSIALSPRLSIRRHWLDRDPEPTREANAAAAGLRCAACPLPRLCRPCRLAVPDMAMADVNYTGKRVKRGHVLYRAGGDSDCVYAIRSGFFKSSVAIEDGREQVTAFRMAGEVLGLDGIDTARHESEAVALEDSEVCMIPYARLEEPGLRRWLYKVMSREMVRDHSVMLLLGMMTSTERVAAFLLGLSQRLAARGLSAHDFHLRMSREEIGSYLGLSLETVSRVFSQLQEEQLLSVHLRHVLILDLPGLKAIALRLDHPRNAAGGPDGDAALTPADA